MSSYHAFGYLTFEAKGELGTIFPSGKVPILPIATQRIRFDSFKDPESVLAIDFNLIGEDQREALREKLGQYKMGEFCLGRFSFRLIGIRNTVFWVDAIDNQV